jgi:uncharacterized protein CbrC (UPF0167 family)
MTKEQEIEEVKGIIKWLPDEWVLRFGDIDTYLIPVGETDVRQLSIQKKGNEYYSRITLKGMKKNLDLGGFVYKETALYVKDFLFNIFFAVDKIKEV